jgi:hypothetical protein
MARTRRRDLSDAPEPASQPAARDPAAGGGTGAAVIGSAEQIAWQRRAAAVLAKLLERAAQAGLPAITWSVEGRGGARLIGRCEAREPRQRRGDFDAWRTALASWTGPRPGGRPGPAGGAAAGLRMASHWERFDGVTVILTADVITED